MGLLKASAYGWSFPQCDIDNRKEYKYVCITTNQPDTKYNPNPNPTTKQHAIVNIQLNIVICPIHIQRNSYETMLLHRLYYFRL